jgi:acyl-CoA thioester hydrolase
MDSPTDFPLTATVRVRTYELDSFAHVNNAEYLRYVEEARSEYLKQVGLSFHDFARYGVQLVIVEAHLFYHYPARYGDEIEIRGRFRDVKSASLLIDYRLIEKTTGKLLATVTTKGAFIDPATGKPTRAPDAFRKAFIASPSLPTSSFNDS